MVLSSTPIPGNEAAVNTTINNLFHRGVDVLYSGGGHEHVHVRGHAGQEELKTVIGLTRPQAFVPIHGEYRHLVMHSRLAVSMGVPEAACHIVQDGDALELTKDQSEVVDRVPASYVYVDGVNVGGVDHTVLRDRRAWRAKAWWWWWCRSIIRPASWRARIESGRQGLRGSWTTRRRCATRRWSTWPERLRRDPHPVEWHALENMLKRQISTFLYREARQRPMVIPVAVEV